MKWPRHPRAAVISQGARASWPSVHNLRQAGPDIAATPSLGLPIGFGSSVPNGMTIDLKRREREHRRRWSSSHLRVSNLPAAPSIPNVGIPPIDPGVWERSQRNEALFRQDPEAKRGMELMRHDADIGSQISKQIQSQIRAIPGQVQPAIANLASIGAQIAAAINGIAASARNAAAAIHGPGNGQTVSVQTALNVDGRTLADVVSYHQVRANITANNPGLP
jgi:hypothetical protein